VTTTFEVIYSFQERVPTQDCDSGEALLANQTFALIELDPDKDGRISEASVLFALLSQLNTRERQLLCKVSIAVRLPEKEALQQVGWLWHEDSPLFEGKLWLNQHLNSRKPIKAFAQELR